MTIPYGAAGWNRPTDETRMPESVATATSLLLTSEQVAEHLQVSLRTVKNLMSDGQIAYIKVGRATRIHRNDFEEYIARNRRKQRNRLRHR